LYLPAAGRRINADLNHRKRGNLTEKGFLSASLLWFAFASIIQNFFTFSPKNPCLISETNRTPGLVAECERAGEQKQKRRRIQTAQILQIVKRPY
jgi:hypothetical protein